MRRENLPAGGHDKVIWKRRRDRSRDKASQQRNSETWWTRTIATLLGVSFGSYRRRRRDVLMGRRGYILLRRFGDVPLIRGWVFHLRLIWDVLETYWWEVPLRRGHDIPIRGRENVPLRRLDDVPLRRHWVFHLRRTCDVAGMYKVTSLRRRHDVLLLGGNMYHETAPFIVFIRNEKRVHKIF